MRQLPNLLTGLRVMLALALPFCMAHRPLFLVLYLICGFTDALDGFLARRLHCQSRLGARLDSVADVLVFGAVLWALIVWAGAIPPLVWALTAGVAAVRVAALIIARVRFGHFAMLHTLANKATGMLLFLYPAEYLLFSTSVLLYPLFVLAALSAIEECVIQLRASELDLDRKGLFFR